MLEERVLTVLLLLAAVSSEPHRELTSLEERDRLAEAELRSEIIERRGMEKNVWQYAGVPAVLGETIKATTKAEKKKKKLPVVQTTTAKAKPLEVTTTAVPPPVLPPMDRRYRRIFNADETVTGAETPYMAALLVNKQLWCGAVLIDSNSFLTAAHCLQLQYNNRFFREYVKMLTVRVGSTNATSGGEVLRVTDIFFHPNYRPETLEHNLAVMKVHKNITMGPTVKVVPISKNPVLIDSANITFYGWGSVLATGGDGGDVLLQKVTLPVYNTHDCMEKYGRDLVTHHNFCAGFISKAKNVCNHDAGGPAISEGLLVGILSFSAKRCDLPDQPAVFTKVATQTDWLLRVGEKKVQLLNTALKSPEYIQPPSVKI